MICLKSNEKSIDLCAEKLLSGKVVIIPTDTVYGFSAIVDENKLTSRKIYQIKGRDENKPFIQLIGNPLDIFKYTNDKIPDDILSYWPGPLTLIVNDKENNSTIAFRCPNDKWLSLLLNKINVPIYSTSVNRSGKPILNLIEDIKNEFESSVDLIIDDGNRINSVASTIVNLSNGKVEVIRQGELKVN